MCCVTLLKKIPPSKGGTVIAICWKGMTMPQALLGGVGFVCGRGVS